MEIQEIATNVNSMHVTDNLMVCRQNYLCIYISNLDVNPITWLTWATTTATRGGRLSTSGRHEHSIALFSAFWIIPGHDIVIGGSNDNSLFIRKLADVDEWQVPFVWCSMQSLLILACNKQAMVNLSKRLVVSRVEEAIFNDSYVCMYVICTRQKFQTRPTTEFTGFEVLLLAPCLYYFP